MQSGSTSKKDLLGSNGCSTIYIGGEMKRVMKRERVRERVHFLTFSPLLIWPRQSRSPFAHKFQGSFLPHLSLPLSSPFSPSNFNREKREKGTQLKFQQLVLLIGKNELLKIKCLLDLNNEI